MAADSGDDPQKRKDTRQYQAIRLDNDMVVLLVSDPQAVKSLSALVVPVGSCRIRQIIRAGAFSGTYDADGVAKISPA